MSIISKETWNKFTQEEKEKIRKEWETKNTAEDNAYIPWYLESLFGKENLQPKPKEYWEIEEELFNHRANQWLSYYIIDWDKPHSTATQIVKSDCTSRKQAEKLLAINKLLNVAAYLNKKEDGTPWKPDWSDENNEFYTLGIDPDDDSVRVIEVNMHRVPTEIVYFRTKEMAKQAVAILGEDTVRLALTTEY